MVWEVTYLLPAILLVFPTSGSRTQEIVSLRRMQGETVSAVCWYPSTLCRKVKYWCLQTPERSCSILVDSRNTGDQRPQFSIQDHPEFNYFTVTMTALQPRNTGFYHCGILESSTMATTLRTFYLLVSKAPIPSSTSRMSTVLASATSPAIDSPETNWTWNVIIAGVTVVIMLLLGLVILAVLYLRKVRGRAKKVENESHIYEDFSVQKETVTGFSEQNLSDEDTGGICYASLVHLNHSSTQGSVYSNTEPCLKPSPDPLLSVEYASISRNRLQPSKSSAPVEEPGD